MSRSRCWCFTINNYKKNLKDLDKCKDWQYMIVGHEVGEEGTPHLQGFVIFNKRIMFNTVKKYLPKAHIEVMQGNSLQASDYCKKDGNWELFGEFEMISSKGGACGGDKKAINYRRVIELAEKAEMGTIRDEDPGVYFRHYHTIKRIAMDNPIIPATLPRLQNEWIWGKTGLGKSSTARRENPGFYIKSHNKWWLGYKGEDCVILDDISRSEANWLGEHLKQWADHYPFPSETKGDGMVIRPKKIVVTSNYSIDDLWGHDEDLCDALKRRFKIRHIIEPFPKPATIMIDEEEDRAIVLTDGYDSDITELC